MCSFLSFSFCEPNPVNRSYSLAGRSWAIDCSYSEGWLQALRIWLKFFIPLWNQYYLTLLQSFKKYTYKNIVNKIVIFLYFNFFYNRKFNSQNLFWEGKTVLCFYLEMSFSFVYSSRNAIVVICFDVDGTRGPQYMISSLSFPPIFCFPFNLTDCNIYTNISKSTCIHYQWLAPYN